MAEERLQRRLAAILAADVVGYSRLMEADEEGMFARMKKLRSDVIDPKVAEYSGRIFKTTGDGFLVEFPSAVDAVRHAVDVQGAMAGLNADIPVDARIAFRIGISLGDVMVDGDDLFGNGVNVAARMEGLADPGGVCISGNVQEHIGNSLDVSLDDLGEQTVKNIDRPVRCYRVHLQSHARRPDNAPSLPDKPTIAVLPFNNMSGDPDQEYFSDGITEDIITALSRIRQFFVIASNTTFTFKDRAVDVQSVAKELRVRYVLEGSVRRSGNRVRITAQLIDGKSGNHLWAERYDRQLEDIFDVQDEITQTVVGAIEPELNRAERERALQTPPENLDAWDYLHRGRWHLYKFEKSAILEAQDYFRRAIEIDPSFAQAHAGVAEAKFISFFLAFSDTPADDLKRGFEAAKTAVALDDKDSVAHATLGVLHLLRREHALATEALQRALTANPNSANAHHWLGLVYAFDGRHDEAIAEQELATRLSPNDPKLWTFMTVRSYAYLNSRRLDQASEWAQRALRQPNATQNPYIVHVIALSHLHHSDEARQASDALLKKFPELSIARIRDKTPFNREEDIEFWVEGLRKAGVPET